MAKLPHTLTLMRLPCLFLCFILTLSIHRASAQTYLLPNEELLYSFETAKGKKVMLAKDKANAYIIYRFGTKDKIEFEYPDKTKDSWSKFTYTFYFRGGGADNEGLDLNYVSFTNKGFQYIIYDTYSAVENKTSFGIKVINLSKEKTTNIPGLPKTQKGTLIDFKENGLLKVGDELFD